MKLINKSWRASLGVSFIYTATYYLAQWAVFTLLIARFPSAQEDDVRIDLGILTLLISYIAALLCTFIVIYFIHKLSSRPVSFKHFILFCILIPVVFQLTQFGVLLLSIISPTFNHASYRVYQISLGICTLITAWIAYWLAFRYHRLN